MEGGEFEVCICVWICGCVAFVKGWGGSIGKVGEDEG